jgi:hypothetical protein
MLDHTNFTNEPRKAAKFSSLSSEQQVDERELLKLETGAIHEYQWPGGTGNRMLQHVGQLLCHPESPPIDSSAAKRSGDHKECLGMKRPPESYPEVPPAIKESVQRARAMAPLPPPEVDPVLAYLSCVYREVMTWKNGSAMLLGGVQSYYDKPLLSGN